MDIENNKEKIERTLTRFAMMVETSRECSPSFSDFVAAIHLGRKERGGMMDIYGEDRRGWHAFNWHRNP